MSQKQPSNDNGTDNGKGNSINNADAETIDAGPVTKEEEIQLMHVRTTARMPVERYAREYKMNHKNRGMALIFNHEIFDPNLLMSPRTGTQKDCKDLESVLKDLNFSVTVYDDYTVENITKVIKKAAETDHSENDCIMVVIMSHGLNSYIYAKDAIYKLDNITHPFTADRCPTLAGKPKLFIIQACQGDGLDAGIQLCNVVTETDGESNSSMSYSIPLHADFLYAFSTKPGFFSWRNKEEGSWFIQSLVSELKDNGKKENILTLLTFVCRRVAIDYESNTPNKLFMDKQKQTPCITSMLTRILHFP